MVGSVMKLRIANITKKTVIQSPTTSAIAHVLSWANMESIRSVIVLGWTPVRIASCAIGTSIGRPPGTRKAVCSWKEKTFLSIQEPDQILKPPKACESWGFLEGGEEVRRKERLRFHHVALQLGAKGSDGTRVRTSSTRDRDSDFALR